jgi:XapX domain-containing protein
MSTITTTAVERVKVILGLLLGLGIGALCRLLAIPSPAPPVLPGALLVVAMTLGYIAADRWLCRRQALHAHIGGGPDGRAPSAARRVDPTA